MQVFINILNNAKEALVEIETSKVIKIDIHTKNNEVVTTVFNNGLAIDENIIHKIFDPYFSTKKKKNGTGLGLYITKEIIELHGGEIWVESQGRNKGSTFVIRLPNKK